MQLYSPVTALGSRKLCLSLLLSIRRFSPIPLVSIDQAQTSGKALLQPVLKKMVLSVQQ